MLRREGTLTLFMPGRVHYLLLVPEESGDSLPVVLDASQDCLLVNLARSDLSY